MLKSYLNLVTLGYQTTFIASMKSEEIALHWVLSSSTRELLKTRQLFYSPSALCFLSLHSGLFPHNVGFVHCRYLTSSNLYQFDHDLTQRGLSQKHIKSNDRFIIIVISFQSDIESFWTVKSYSKAILVCRQQGEQIVLRFQSHSPRLASGYFYFPWYDVIWRPHVLGLRSTILDFTMSRQSGK